MKISLIYELQVPRPWDDGSEQRVLLEALEQIEIADRLGFHCVWAVEHHFLEEYSHSSAPEVFLAAASQRTKKIRLGHGIIAIVPNYNHPARVAERVATLDLVSNGRVEFGTGETGTPVEWLGFNVDIKAKRELWEEAMREIPRMFVQTPYVGHDGPAFSMPSRNVIPKPRQKPHPPLWMACSREERITEAAERAMGALTFSFVEPSRAGEYVATYYEAFENAVPIGYAANPNVAFAMGFLCADTEQAALTNGLDGAHFFSYSLGHYAAFADHEPGKSSVAAGFATDRDSLGLSREAVTPDGKALSMYVEERELDPNADIIELNKRVLRGAIGTPTQVEGFLSHFEDAGADEVLLVVQHGMTRHEDICASLELFGTEVLPEFLERDVYGQSEKQKRLAPAIERVMARRPPDAPAPPTRVPPRVKYLAEQGAA